ncbi:MAG: hypothetical protein LQ348_007277 [Seirophora lacunosa]|nr:MAG: hypothetical protein LQ348_007277 [Seirophora lacunosa]
MSNQQQLQPIIFLLGPPNAGKSYLCKRAVKEIHGLEHVVMSDLLRWEEKRPHSPWAEEIQSKLPTGTLVSSDACIFVLGYFLRGLPDDPSRKIILDGFPRNLDQARKFEEQMGTAMATIELVCTPETLEKRRKARARADDEPTIAKGRYQGFLDETIPTIEHLRGVVPHVIQVCSDQDGDEGFKLFEDAIAVSHLSATCDLRSDLAKECRRVIKLRWEKVPADGDCSTMN